MLTLDRMVRTLGLFGCLTLAGCVSAHKLDQALAIPVGMNEVQVANKIGEPGIKVKDQGLERWIWSREGQLGSESVTLIMKDGRVAAVECEGERLKHLEELQRLERTEQLLDAQAREQLLSRAQKPEEHLLPLKGDAARTPAPELSATNAPASTNTPPPVAVPEELPFRHEKS